MINEKNIRPDGQLSTALGMDSSKHPADIDEKQVALSANIVHRGGHAASRPGFRLPPIINSCSQDGLDTPYTYATSLECQTAHPTGVPIRTYKWTNNETTGKAGYMPVWVPSFDRLPAGNYQAAMAYQHPLVYPQGFMFLVKDGCVYIAEIGPSFVSLRKVAVQDEGNEGPFLDPDVPINIIQADQYAVFQDGFNTPLIWDGTLLRRAKRSDPRSPEVPTGFWMAYDGFRLWVAWENWVYAGDINGGPTSIVTFSENTYATGPGFRFPNPVTALVFVPQTDSNTGFGSLAVFTRSDTHFIQAQVTKRLDWQLTPNMQGYIMRGVGCISGWSIVAYGQDVFFRSVDGFRTLRYARAEMGNLLNTLTPISNELQYWVDYEDESLLAGTASILYDRRFLSSGNLTTNGLQVIGNAILALDTTPTANIRQPSQPAWDGAWYGFRPFRFVKGVFGNIQSENERAFCLSFDMNLDGTETPRLWELTKKDEFDNGDGENHSSAVCVCDSRAFACGSEILLKRFLTAELEFVDTWGKVTLKVQYRTNHENNWLDWDNKTWEIAESLECQEGVGPVDLEKGGVYRMRTVTLDSSQFDELNQREQRVGYLIQLRLIWQGHAKISKILLLGVEREDNARGNAKMG